MASELVADFVSACRVRRLRTIREFAEQEIVLPTGPFRGSRFRCDRQPFTRVWFDELESRQWTRHFAVGPTQSGKSLSCFVIPAMYHLFEIGETVICGVPSLDMCGDKWRLDFLPVVQESRYREFLPSTGPGSRGGNPTTIEFGNGAVLKFMTGGGSDKVRAGFTSRVLCVTETDGFDEVGGKSLEADKFTQLEGRVRAFNELTGQEPVIYAECTVTVEQGRTWREYTSGTHSRIVRPCPHCGRWIAPDREHLVGYKDAETVREAMDAAAWMCPECTAVISDAERLAMNAQSRLVHDGQTINEAGDIEGPAPRTNTLGFRWNAFDNCFQGIRKAAEDEWKALHSEDEENEEKRLCQQVWALPYRPPIEDLSRLDALGICARHIGMPAKGIVPATVHRLGFGMDLGKRLGHWSLLSCDREGTPHTVDYGRIEIPSDDIAFERAVVIALNGARDLCEIGWPDEAGDMHRPGVALFDSGYQGDTTQTPVYDWVGANSQRYWAAKGHGASQDMAHVYGRPRQTGATVIRIGNGWHVARIQLGAGRGTLDLVEFDADFWKSWLHSRWQTPLGEQGAMTVFRVERNGQHLSFAKHQTAEKKISEYKAGKGVIERWERISRDNHWLDSTVLAGVALTMCGAPTLGATSSASRRSARHPIRHRQREIAGPGASR